MEQAARSDGPRETGHAGFAPRALLLVPKHDQGDLIGELSSLNHDTASTLVTVQITSHAKWISRIDLMFQTVSDLENRSGTMAMHASFHHLNINLETGVTCWKAESIDLGILKIDETKYPKFVGLIETGRLYHLKIPLAKDPLNHAMGVFAHCTYNKDHKEIRNFLAGTRELNLFLMGTEAQLLEISKLNEEMRAQHNNDPFTFNFPSRLGETMIRSEKGLIHSPSQRLNIRTDATMSFANPNHYISIFTTFLQEQREWLAQEMNHIIARAELIAVNVPNLGKRAYLGLLKNAPGQVKLKYGDRVQIRLCTNGLATGYNAYVLPETTNTPLDRTPLLITIPVKPEDIQPDDDDGLQMLGLVVAFDAAKVGSQAEYNKLVNESLAQECEVELLSSESTIDVAQQGLDGFCLIAANKTNPGLVRFILGNDVRPYSTSSKDVFAYLGDKADATIRRMCSIFNLDTEQVSALNMLRCAGPASFIVGQGGTGKSLVMRVAAATVITTKPMSPLSSEHALVMLLSTLNTNANDMALKMMSTLAKVKKEHRQECMVIRLHSPESELRNFLHSEKDGSMPIEKDVINRKPSIAPSGITAAIVNDLTRAHDNRGVLNDDRAVLRQASLGIWMQRIIGLFGTDDPFYVPQKYTGLRKLYDTYIAGKKLTQQQSLNFDRLTKLLRRDVLNMAHAICTTLYHASTLEVTSSGVAPDFIGIDEANRCKSLEMSAILVAFQKSPILAAGDMAQNDPFAVLDENTSTHYSTGNLSEMSRMLLNGARSERLTMQHRQLTFLNAFSSVQFYDGTARSAPGVDEEPIAAEILAYNKRTYNVATSLILLEVHGSECERLPPTNSRINTVQASVLMVELEKFVLAKTVSTKEIGVLNAYGAQTMLLKNMLAVLHAQHPSAGFQEIDVLNVDACNGREKQVMFITLTVTDSLGFIENPKRVNVMTSREQYGLYCVFDSITMAEWTSTDDEPAIIKFIQWYRCRGCGYKYRPATVNEKFMSAIPKNSIASSNGKGRAHGKPRLCYICKEPGHIAKDCVFSDRDSW